MKLETVEAALDHGQLWARVGVMRYHKCRRNGATRRWKRDPERFEIPLKYGFKSYGTADNHNVSDELGASSFLISVDDPSVRNKRRA